MKAAQIGRVDRGDSAGIRWATGITECWGWVDWTLARFSVAFAFADHPDFEVVQDVGVCDQCKIDPERLRVVGG